VGESQKDCLYSKSTQFIGRFLTDPSLFLQSKRLSSLNWLIHAIPRILNMRLPSICSVAAILVFGIGCSFEPTRYPISGTVKINGASGAYAVIVFTPVAGPTDSYRGGSVTTDNQGKFSLGDKGKNTGLLAGDHKVTFTQTLINGKPAHGGGGSKKSEQLVGEKEAVPAAYRKAETTPITVKIGSTPTIDFDVK
jgi:hypothetical protein